MSQKHVEWLLGRLTTDRSFRERFYDDPAAICAREAVDLTTHELAALLSLDEGHIEEFSKRLDPRIVRSVNTTGGVATRRTARASDLRAGRMRGAK